MTRPPRTRLEIFTEDLLWAPDRFQRENQIRAYVLEQATELEGELDEVLAASIARSMAAADLLQAEVLWRLTIGVRIEMLDDLLERRGFRDRWPFVVPVLRAFFDLRHQLAHGFVTSAPDGSGIEISTIKRGRSSTSKYAVGRLEWLAWQAYRCETELNLIWAAVVSHSAVRGDE